VDPSVAGESTPWSTDLDVPEDDQGRLDLVESTPRRLTSPQRRWAVVAGALLVIITLLAWYADGRRRASEFDRLARCVAAGESARVDADTRIAGMSSYVRPSLGVSSAPGVDESLYVLVARQALVGEPEVRRAAEDCRHVALLPFHSQLKSARSAYLAYLDSEAQRLSAITADGSKAFDGSDDLVALRTSALTALRSAAPDGSERQRLDRLTRVEQ
jgi:hypothetical protein